MTLPPGVPVPPNEEPELQQLQARCRLAEARLAEVQQIARLGYWDWDVSEGRIWWSDELYQIFGVAPGEAPITYDKFLSLVHPDDRQAVQQKVPHALTAGASYDVRYRIARPDGTVRTVAAMGGVTCDAAGSVLHMAGTVQDVTDQTRLEQALFDSEVRWRTMFQIVPAAVTLADARGRYVLVNPAWVRMTGYTAEELLAMNYLDLTHPEDLETTRRFMVQAARGEIDDFACEKRYLRKNGEMFWGRLRVTIVRSADGALVYNVAAIEDITAQKESESLREEAQLRQRKALTEEVHHRIMNSFQSVAGLLERYTQGNPACRPILEAAITQVNTLAMMHGLHSENVDGEVNLCNIVRGIVQMLKLSSTVPISIELPEQSPVRVTEPERVPIALILNELIFNALKYVDASAEGAAVTVQVVVDATEVRVVVRNAPARLPEHIDIANDATLGTGLRLVRLLMPRRGAMLTLAEASPGTVEAILRLSAPALDLTASEAPGRPQPLRG
jgi:PAS domain S-box-containing protein